MKAYIEISVEKELPKEAEELVLVTDNKIGHKNQFEKTIGYYSNKNGYWVIKGQDQSHADHITHFLREFSLPELMEEYTKFVRQYQIIRVYKTDKELTEEFLTKKGIL